MEKKYRPVGTVPKSNRKKNVERGKLATP